MSSVKELKAKFAKMSTADLLKMAVKGEMKLRDARVAAEIFEKRMTGQGLRRVRVW